jgi:protein gp37
MTMSDKSRIEWTERTWSPITGCTKVSQGCKNCYAEREVETRWSKNPKSIWFGRKFTDIQCHPEQLDAPMRWKTPLRIFVCPRSDLFHESVPDEFIDRVFAVMALCHRNHTFQILTKRPKRMRDYLNAPGVALRVQRVIFEWRDTPSEICQKIACGALPGMFNSAGENPQDVAIALSNVWLGVSIEDQITAEERIPLLLETPAAVRWVSAEPLLGPIKLDGHEYIHWLVVGGESGPNARPMQIEWARSLRDQCVVAGVPYFFKQWGEFHPTTEYRDGKVFMNRIGKKAAGRLLDGRTWDQYPGGSNASAV